MITIRNLLYKTPMQFSFYFYIYYLLFMIIHLLCCIFTAPIIALMLFIKREFNSVKVWEDVKILMHKKSAQSVRLFQMNPPKVLVVGRFLHYFEIMGDRE